MACPDENVVDAFVHGRGAPAERAEVAAHLASCTGCRRLVSALAEQLGDHGATIDTGAATLHAAVEDEASHAPLFVAGELLAERYRIVGFVAEGGMGEVYEAEDLELRRRVALKTVRAHIASDPRALERFRREIALAHEVTHKNVCRIFDLGFHVRKERITFLTMEFLGGETLSARLRRTGKLTPDEALPIVAQLTEGLAAAHAVGVVHRDFKSANVMLVPHAHGTRVVISDFGLAATTTDGEGMSSASGLVGSPAYMAPEQVEGRRADARSDLYALGVVLYEMVTGQWPFVADTPMLTAMKRLQEAPVSPLVRNPSLDARWAQVILRCMAREPDDRFASATDVLRALEAPTPRRSLRYALALAALCVSGLGLWIGTRVTRTTPTGIVQPVVPAPVPAIAPPASSPVASPSTPHAKPHVDKRPTKPAAPAPQPARWNGEIVDPEESK